ncbi:MAG TPA: hypothetical protein VFQ58_07380, partial [Flavisolibacter sp.]|nr:hypothetical protein [Flavisolibacter sp.]
MKKLIWLTLYLLVITVGLMAQQPIISFGDSWKYLDNGSNQGTAWKDIPFNDGLWKTGSGKFGYGISDANQIIGFGADQSHKYITSYFRKTINLTNPTSVARYFFDVKRDDGIIVYVNGKEVYRNNMSSGTILYNTLATSANDNGTAIESFSLSNSAFIAGTNLIAVEVHQQNGDRNDRDMAFDLSLTPPDITPPVIKSINRQNPIDTSTRLTSVVYRVTFSEKVTGVNAP